MTSLLLSIKFVLCQKELVIITIKLKSGGGITSKEIQREFFLFTLMSTNNISINLF